jgi:hypothetical protein
MMASNEFELFFQVMVEDSLWLDSFDVGMSCQDKALSTTGSFRCHNSSLAGCAGTQLLTNPGRLFTEQHQQDKSSSHAITTLGLLKRASLDESIAINRVKRPCMSTSEDNTTSRGGAISIQQLLN